MIKFSKTDSIQNIDVKNFFNKYNYLLWSLGIGDFLSLDSFIPDFFYNKIEFHF